MSDTIQSANELACAFWRECVDGSDFEGIDYDEEKATKLVEADRAAHIAIGRELERKASAAKARKQAERFAACVEALRLARDQIESLALTLQGLRHKEGYERGLRCMYDADKALADLEATK
jgi:hypothetical protein